DDIAIVVVNWKGNLALGIDKLLVFPVAKSQPPIMDVYVLQPSIAKILVGIFVFHQVALKTSLGYIAFLKPPLVLTHFELLVGIKRWHWHVKKLGKPFDSLGKAVIVVPH